LKQQIKYYKELNASLKEEIETVKKCKKLKQLEQLNEKNNLSSRKEKDEINNLISSNNYSETEKMREEWNQNEFKITDLEKKNKRLEESVIQLKSTLDKANDIFPNLLEKLEKHEGGLKGKLDFQTSSNFDYSKSTQTNHAKLIYGNSCSEEQSNLIMKEIKRHEEEEINSNNVNKDYNYENNKLKSQLNDNKILIEKLRNEVNENKKEINENKTLIDKLKEQKLKLEIEINKNKETIEKLEKNIPDKEGYENELNENKILIQQLKTEVIKYENEINEKNITIEKLEQSKPDKNEYENELNQNKILIDKLKGEKLELEREINQNKETIEKLEKNIIEKYAKNGEER